MEGCPFFKTELRIYIKATMCPVLGGGMPAARCVRVKMNKVIVQTEMLRNSSFPKGLNSYNSAGHRAALPFPVCKGSAASCWGVNGLCTVLHSDGMVTILLADKFSWQHFKSIPLSSK